MCGFERLLEVKNFLGDFAFLGRPPCLPSAQVPAELGGFVEDDVVVAPDVVAESGDELGPGAGHEISLRRILIITITVQNCLRLLNNKVYAQF